MTGSIVGGPNIDANVESAIRDITMQLHELQSERHAPFLVNLIYQVGGEFMSPDFAGVRTGRFTKKDGILVVQAAVPEGHIDDAYDFIYGLLVQSIDAVEDWANRRRELQVPMPELRQVVQAVHRH